MYHVYVVKDKRHECKVGMTKNVQARVKQLQTGHPMSLSVAKVFSFESKMQALHIEKSIHKMYRNHKMKGEWFNKSWFKVFCAQLDKYGSIEILTRQYHVPGMSEPGKKYDHATRRTYFD
jgi:predicted GIY-YIG superfamily endonuclease